MPDNPRKTFLAYLSQVHTRSLIVEFKGGFTAVSGVFTISGISESNVQLRLAASTCVTCDLDIALPALPQLQGNDLYRSHEQRSKACRRGFDG